MKSGVVSAALAYILWGFFPIYFKFIHDVPAIQIVGHRIVWSFVFLSLLVLLRKEWKQLQGKIQGPRFLSIFFVSSLLLATNWLVYVYGVNAGFIIETSLGYFISPLASVLFGVVFLRERLRAFQWIPVVLAVAGVLYLTFLYGRLPWIALLLALSFSLYGLVKKTAPISSFHGLVLETGMLFIPSMIFLLIINNQGIGSFGQADLQTTVLLILTGPITAIPLLLFGSAARRIDLTLLGLLQYISPTIQFLIGVIIFKESFSTSTLIGFIFIWLALIFLWLESFIGHRKSLALEPN